MKARLLVITTLLLLAVSSLSACGGEESPRLSKGRYTDALLDALLDAQDAAEKRFFSSINQECRETVQLNAEFIEDMQELRIRSAEISSLHDEWILTLQEENAETERWCEFREQYKTQEEFENSLTYDSSEEYEYYWNSDEYKPLGEARENNTSACEALMDALEREEEDIC